MASYGAEFLTVSAVCALGFASVGEDVKIHPSTIIVGIENVHIGSYSRIDAHTITASSTVRIGSFVHIGAETGANRSGSAPAAVKAALPPMQ
jgi:UDP-3-O-[3-hydroxymyristoyl] glucosamine N-acyltransferase